MNKRQTRFFAIGASLLSALAFIGLTLDSHRQFGKLTNADQITPAVTRGKDVWHKNNCINCHTVFGEGAYYAPDLTKITKHRGEAYLKAYMRDPSKFYDETRHRRLMPKQDLSETDITDLIAFLDWVSNVDNQGWPPRPILVTGSALPGGDNPLAHRDAAATVADGTAAAPPGARPLAGQGHRSGQLPTRSDRGPQCAPGARGHVLGRGRVVHAEHLCQGFDGGADRAARRLPVFA